MTTMPTAEYFDEMAGHLEDKFLEPRYAEAVRTIATLLRQTTEGTDALHHRHIFNGNLSDSERYKELLNLCRAYEQRLKVVEAKTVERCAKLADEYLKGAAPSSTMACYLPNAIRALSAKVGQEPVQALAETTGTPEGYNQIERRIRGERRVIDGGWGDGVIEKYLNERSGADRRQNG